MEQADPLFFARFLRDPEMGGFRFRIGHYRVIFDVAGGDILVHSVGHRSEIYRK